MSLCPNTTFLLRLRIDSEDRLINTKITLKLLLEILKVKVILVENGIESNYDKFIVEIKDLENLQYYFQQNHDTYFHQTAITNFALTKVKTTIVCVYDIDTILPVQSYIDAEKIILEDKCDIVYPFRHDYFYPIDQKDKSKIDLSDIGKIKKYISKKTYHKNLVGFVIFLKTEVFRANGGDNEEFKGYGFEDDNRYHVFSKLGYRLVRILDDVYHMEHFRGINSNFSLNYIKQNKELLSNLVHQLDNKEQDTTQVKQLIQNTSSEYTYHNRDLFYKIKGYTLEQYKFYCLFHGIPFAPANYQYLIPLLQGGLGNQLFQIASAYGIAKHNNKILRISEKYKAINVHSSLNYFNTVFSKILRVDQCNCNVYLEKPEHYSTYINPKLDFGSYLLQGYFQNQGYFKDYKSEIIELFKLESQEYKNLDNSFFIHLRYFPPEDGGSLHDIDLSKYLEKVCFNLGDLCDTAHFYVCSNDLGAVIRRYNLSKFKNKTLVTDLNELQTLGLMVQCAKGGICSNSSLSWWGSYLNPSADKKIYFPGKYLKNDWPCNIFTDDMIVVPI